MSETFRCDDKDTLVAYLYGEIEADARREVERHLRTCAACSLETGQLRAVRHDLESWLPPEADLGFTIVQNSPVAVLRPQRWAIAKLPVWAQVAAATLVIAASAALLNLQVRSTADGFVVTTGWMQPVAPVAAAPAMVTSNEEWRRELAALEQNLRRELTPKTAAVPTSSRVTETTDTAAVLRRVQDLLAASETRQREELAFRLASAERDWNIRRQTDLMNINQTIGRVQMGALRTERGQQEMVNLLRRVSATQPIP